MRRRFEVRGLPARAMTEALLTVFLAALPASAGLVFDPVKTLPGADATALAGSGATLWAATPRGVWRLDAGTWTLDGLSAQRISSIVVADAVYAADGEKVWRRGADGTWSAEALPAASSFPRVLATDGTAVWAAGLGVAKRSSGTWAPLANPGGLVTAAAVVLRRSRRRPARGRGAVRRRDGHLDLDRTSRRRPRSRRSVSRTARSTRAPTRRSLLLRGSVESRSPASACTTCAPSRARAARCARRRPTRGFSRSRAPGRPRTAGLLVASAKSFGTLGSDLYVGTAGAPVSPALRRHRGAPAGTGLVGGVDLGREDRRGDDVRGRARCRPRVGLAARSEHRPGRLRRRGRDRGQSRGAFSRRRTATCTAWALGPGLSGPPSIVEAGLPLGVAITSLAAVTGRQHRRRHVERRDVAARGQYVVGRQLGSSRERERADDARGGREALRLRRRNLFVREQSAWQAVAGAPAFVQALGGDATVLFAAPVSGGIFSSAGSWREDDFGAGTAFVSSLDVGGGMAFAGAGTAGVLRRTAGGWQPENAGLPAGADVRVVRQSADGSHPVRGHRGQRALCRSGLFVREVHPRRPRRRRAPPERASGPTSRSGTARRRP